MLLPPCLADGSGDQGKPQRGGGACTGPLKRERQQTCGVEQRDWQWHSSVGKWGQWSCTSDL